MKLPSRRCSVSEYQSSDQSNVFNSQSSSLNVNALKTESCIGQKSENYEEIVNTIVSTPYPRGRVRRTSSLQSDDEVRSLRKCRNSVRIKNVGCKNITFQLSDADKIETPTALGFL